MPNPSPSTPTVLKLQLLQLGRRSGGRSQREFTPGGYLSAVIHTRGLRVYPYPRVNPTRLVTRGSGRVGLRRVGSGRVQFYAGTDIPGFTRALYASEPRLTL